MIRRAVLGLIALGMLITPASALDRMLTEEEAVLIQEINAHHSEIKTMAGRFEQIDTMGNRTKGLFFLKRPDKIAFRYAPPSRQQIVSVGEGFFLIDRGERTVQTYPQDSVPLREFLTDDINLFSANIFDVVSSETHISVTLIDDTPVGSVEVALIFDKLTKDLVQWTLTEPSGAELTFSVYDVEVGLELPETLFTIPHFFSE
ncbi:MAG: outer membrane lipoprotein carrier protein LolA [Alphaproteobacteria bacterium]|nr:outer membrane lipoprotein carrier protein LolA [Alphaproteobacteria bacterium]